MSPVVDTTNIDSFFTTKLVVFHEINRWINEKILRPHWKIPKYTLWYAPLNFYMSLTLSFFFKWLEMLVACEHVEILDQNIILPIKMFTQIFPFVLHNVQTTSCKNQDGRGNLAWLARALKGQDLHFLATCLLALRRGYNSHLSHNICIWFCCALFWCGDGYHHRGFV